MTEAEAIAVLEALNADGASLTWEVVYAFSSSVPSGDVISTVPPAGEFTAPDEHVIINVSQGAVPSTQSRFVSALNQDVVAVSTASVGVGAAPKNLVVMSVFAFLDIDGDPIRVCDSGCTHRWGGFEWLGVGRFGSIDVVSESIEMITSPVTLTLSGVEEQYIQAAMASAYRGRDVELYLGFFDPDTLRLIDTPEEIWSGHMDVMTIEGDHGTAVIKVTCEHRLRLAPVTARYTDEDQRTRHPLDVFFNKLHLISTYIGRWGGNNVRGRPGGGGSNPVGPRRRSRPH